MATETEQPVTAERPVLVQVDDGVARITPQPTPAAKRAQPGADAGADRRAAFGSGADPDVRAIVLAGAGVAFSSGHDLSEMVGRRLEDYQQLFDVCTELMQTIHNVPQPVIARVHGVATAAGCQLVATCDLAVASEAARFGTPGVRIGLFCSTPMVPLSRAVGRKRAMEMLLTGELIDACDRAGMGTGESGRGRRGSGRGG